MTDRRLAALERAARLLLEAGEGEHADEIDSLKAMFAVQPGCSPEEARARRIANAQCQNCDFTWPAMAMPAPLTVTALAAQRLAQCPRCHATEHVTLNASS